MNKFLSAVVSLILLSVVAQGASFPYVTLNSKTNRLSDNGTNLTYNGTAVGTGTGITGTVLNTTVANSLAMPDSSKTNLIAATSAAVSDALGYIPFGGLVSIATSNGVTRVYMPAANTDAARGTALSIAMATVSPNDKITVGPGSYLLTNTLTLLTGNKLSLSGRLYTASTSADIINLTNATDVAISGSGIIEGAGASAGATTDSCGVRVIGNCDNFSVTGITFRFFKGAGVYLGNAFSTRHMGAFVNGVTFATNNWGLYITNRSEYHRISSCVINSNLVAIYNDAGNNHFENCTINNNATGIYVDAGTNDGHGIISGCSLNHNTYPFYFNGLTLGMTCVGNHVFEGTITVADSTGVNLISGMMQTVTVALSGTLPGPNTIKDVWFLDEPTMSATDAQRAKLLVSGCYAGSSNTSTNNNNYPGTLTHAGTVTIDFGAAKTFNSLSATGSCTFAFSNVSFGSSYKLKFVNAQATNITVTFPTGIGTATNWIGGACSTTIPPAAVALWSMTAFGTTDASVLSAWGQTQ